MEKVIERYKEIVIQIATPYNTGTGFFVDELDLIVTSEHVVRDNKTVVVDGLGFTRQLVKVLFTDAQYDLAFLAAPLNAKIPKSELHKSPDFKVGDAVLAVGEPFGLQYLTSQGQITNTDYKIDDLVFFEHEATMHPINSGGPVLNNKGEVLGVNTFILRNDKNVGFALPIKYLMTTFEAFKKGDGKTGCKCLSCNTIVFDDNPLQNICPNCNKKIDLPVLANEFVPVGIAQTVEGLLEENGFEVALARRGPNNWEIQQGSAIINISYYEKSGLIIGDAYLCTLPTQNIQPLYEYLLRQNHKIEGLTFSLKGSDVVLSLMIYDQYLNDETGHSLLKRLFESADDYDNILVEQFGAEWKVRNS